MRPPRYPPPWLLLLPLLLRPLILTPPHRPPAHVAWLCVHAFVPHSSLSPVKLPGQSTANPNPTTDWHKIRQFSFTCGFNLFTYSSWYIFRIGFYLIFLNRTEPIQYTCGNCAFMNWSLKIDSKIILFLNCGYILKHFPFPYAGVRFQVAGGVPREPFAGSLQALIVLKLRSSLSCARLKQRPQIECSPVCERKHSALGQIFLSLPCFYCITLPHCSATIERVVLKHLLTSPSCIQQWYNGWLWVECQNAVFPPLTKTLPLTIWSTFCSSLIRLIRTSPIYFLKLFLINHCGFDHSLPAVFLRVITWCCCGMFFSWFTQILWKFSCHWNWGCIDITLFLADIDWS